MVDYLSLQRIRPNGYKVPEVRVATRNLPKFRLDQHDCRPEIVKPHLPEDNQIRAIFSVALVNDDILKFHEKNVFVGSANSDARMKIGYDNKLLYSRGGTGKQPGLLFYPRGLAVSQETGDIFVADSGNRRVQVFGSPGLLKDLFERDANDKRFELPVSIAVSPSGRVVVADAKRNVISSLFWEGARTIHLRLPAQPTSVQFIDDSRLFVACDDGHVRQMDTDSGKEIGCIQVLPAGNGVMSIAFDHNRRELYVSDGIHPVIGVYDSTGRFSRTLSVMLPDSRLGCVPSSISVSSLNSLIVADALNHVVYAFSLPDGEFQGNLLRPTDDLGAVHSVCETPEGHLVDVEYTANTPHSLKIFRYRRCKCHNPSEDSLENVESQRSGRSGEAEKSLSAGPKDQKHQDDVKSDEVHETP